MIAALADLKRSFSYVDLSDAILYLIVMIYVIIRLIRVHKNKSTK